MMKPVSVDDNWNSPVVGGSTPTTGVMAPSDAHLIHSHYTNPGGAAQDPVWLLTGLLNGDPVDREVLAAACPGLHLGMDPQQHPAAVKAYLTTRPDLLEAMLRTDPASPRPMVPQYMDPRIPKRWTTEELLTAEFPPLEWVVEKILPTGLIIIAGRPKVGKSFLVLRIVFAVGTGGTVLGQATTPGRVLYLALEDSPRRLQARMQTQGWSREAQVDFYTEWPDLLGGGFELLETMLEAEGYVLIVVDTLSRCANFRQAEIEDATLLFGRLQKMAMEHNCSILVIDHHRKQGDFSGDPIDDILGSTAKSAVPDAVAGLFRKRGAKRATFKITGRDIDEQSLTLDWDAVTYSWRLVEAADSETPTDLQQLILDALRAFNGQATVTQLADHLGRDKGQVSRALSELVTQGFVIQGKRRGREVPYFLAAQPGLAEADSGAA